MQRYMSTSLGMVASFRNGVLRGVRLKKVSETWLEHRVIASGDGGQLRCVLGCEECVAVPPAARIPLAPNGLIYERAHSVSSAGRN